MTLSFKQINGEWWWFGSPTNNALDREKETISRKAIENDVKLRPSGDQAGKLWYGHVKGLEIGTVEVRFVVDGFLVEAGKLLDRPHAKAITEYIASHPEGLNGQGWGMSHGFVGRIDADNVYHEILIKERSVLPLSRAANPYTLFQVKGNKMDATKQAALEELAKMLANDPVAIEAAKTAIATAEKAKSLDDAGILRKSTETELPTDEVKAKKPMPKEDSPEDEDMEGESTDAEDGKGKKKKPIKAVKVSADDLSDEILAGIETRIQEAAKDLAQKSVDALVSQLSPQLEALATVVSDLQDRVEAFEMMDQKAKARNEAPRQLAERMKALSAALSDDTVVADTDPLAKTVKPSSALVSALTGGK